MTTETNEQPSQLGSILLVFSMSMTALSGYGAWHTEELFADMMFFMMSFISGIYTLAAMLEVFSNTKSDPDKRPEREEET